MIGKGVSKLKIIGIYMKLFKKIVSSNLIKGVIITLGVSALVIPTSTLAHHRPWPGPGPDRFTRGLIIGGMLGIMTGAAVASSRPAPYYAPSYAADPYYGYTTTSCKKVYKKCRIVDGYYGPEKVCQTVTKRVC